MYVHHKFWISTEVAHMSLVLSKPVFGVSEQVRHKPAVQSQKMSRCLRFQIKEVEGLYYPCSENKGADQLRGHREADLRLCFCICKKPVFSRRGSYSIDLWLLLRADTFNNTNVT